MENNWYALKSPRECISPALLVYPERISRNIGLMLQIAGGPKLLRPHVKTHKMEEVIRMQQEAGIYKFKCATIAEAELLGRCKAADVLLAIQPVGPNLLRFLKLQESYPDTVFSTLLDNAGIALQLNDLALKSERVVPVYMDLNVGMNRTGIAPDNKAASLYETLHNLPGLRPMGFHVYDGHIRNSDPDERREACNAAFSPVIDLKKSLEARGFPVPVVVAGGSPSFPIHSGHPEVETSPGTTLLWDAGYAGLFPDMPFLPAAVLHSRIISKPGPGLLCLDLGHKAIAPEMPFPRVRLLEMEDCEQRSQSEEHLVLSCKDNTSYELGDSCYAIPMHICPTVAKYPHVYVVVSGEITGVWQVAARDHKIQI